MAEIVAADKRLNEMDRLADMLHFPAVVHAGATFNVLVTIGVTWWLELRSPLRVVGWIAAVLLLNLVPVVLLRMTLGPRTEYPTLRTMNFFRDQHKFSDWVYLAASADMVFWILLAWMLGEVHRTAAVLVTLELVAFLVTFSPVLLRPLLQSRRA